MQKLLSWQLYFWLHYYARFLFREQSSTKQVCEERPESCSSGARNNPPLTKHMDSSEDDVDKACLSDSRTVPVSENSMVQLAVDGVDIGLIGDPEWAGDFRPSDARIADVREISPESEGGSLDIPVVSPPVNESSFQP